MTRNTARSLLLSLSTLLALGGCGGGGLTASGSATVTDSAHTRSGFQFAGGVRINGGSGTNSGSCQISRGASGVYGVVVDLYGDSQGVGHSVRSMSIMAHSDSPATGQITADLGGDDFSGTCSVAVTSLDEGHGSVTLTTNGCSIADHSTPAQTATADVALSFTSCIVL